MLRRKPTRLELKIDDIEEFESMKKELEARKRQREECESGAGSSILSPGESVQSSTPLSRAAIINERVGYKPHPALPTLFGNW
ncbi:anaphase-promoting complex subunit CDC26-like [Cololabis saira]|uniref:anaphase-promoting complex subunit CDC26-like n=1 Tax=Cololabis saira TaxID=129043 RepID=UPI002AD262DF|nr:anaphase-promoting complex subunit CDC26-like [Cololabis saira]